MGKNIRLVSLILLAVAAGGLLLPQICHANMVIGFVINYPPLFLTLSFMAVVVVEAAELKKRLGLSPKKSMVISLVANAVSSLIGVVGGYLLKADIFKDLTHIAGWLAILFLGSFILETLIMMLFSIPQARAKIWQAGLMMNLISYLFLILFAVLDIFLFSGFIILAFIIERLFNIFGWAKNWSKAKTLLVQFSIFILACGVNYLLFMSLISGGSTNVRAKDARVMSAMSQAKPIMDFIYANYGDYDKLQYTYPDMQPLVDDVQHYSYLKRSLIIAHSPSASSSAACMFAPLNVKKGKTWYCIDNQGNRGIVDKNPYDSAYCWEGQSAKCPPIIERLY